MGNLNLKQYKPIGVKHRSRHILLYAIDILTIFCASFLVYWFFLERQYEVGDWFIHSAVLALTVLVGRIVAGVYVFVWRYASAINYLTLCLADCLAGIAFYAVERLIIERLGVQKIPFFDMVLVAMITLLATVFFRFLYQAFRSHHLFRALVNWCHRRLGKEIPPSAARKKREQKRIAIIGAGQRGVLLADSLRSDPNAQYIPYCFFDHDTQKVGNTVRGLKIYPVDNTTIRRIRDLPIQEIVIAIHDLTPEQKMELFDFYEKSGLKVRIYDVPSMEERNAHRRIRDIRIEDLLFRDAISVIGGNLSKVYGGKTVMITGGGGSIGSELCRQVAKLEPKKLVILDIYENNVYEIQQELRREYGDALDVVCEIASVRDAEKIEAIFMKHRPEVVFHAAAHKHVPLMEDCCDEAVKNNVFGTFNVVNAAEKAQADKFIMISTDKAVNPTNIMGATKRLCEMIIQSKKDSATDFVAVRFGNVLGSNGSVIPLFMRQIENGGPITITDKRIIRYFMTIPEASQLVMQAGASAAKGEIYVLDMGKPMQILTLAENMIRLAGLKPYEDIDIQEVGLRPGEKLYEELLMKTEELDKTDNEKIFIERERKIPREELLEKLKIVNRALATRDNDAIRKAMMEVVPTYRNAETVNRDALNTAEMRSAIENRDTVNV